MHDNLIREYEKYPTAKELWDVLKVAYGSTSATRLRALTLRFNQYVLDPKHSMIQHLDVMKDMIRELQNASCELSDEQQVLAVLRSLLSRLGDIESERAQQAAFVAHAGQRKPHKGKRWNKPNGAGPSQSQKQNLAPQDTGATKYVTRDRAGFVDYHRVPKCSHYIAMGNGAQRGVYLLSHRSEALDCFKRFLAEVENQREVNLKVFRTDRGREYLSEQFKQICEDKGIIRQLTIPYTPQQNGVAERRNRTLLEMARSMMAQANLPISFWGDAILTAAYILNRVPSKSIPTTPYELWHGRKLNLEGLRLWGSAGFLEEDFPSISEVKGNLELYELRDPQGGASITVEGETPRSYPVIDEDNESDPKLSGSCSLEEHNSQNPQMRRSKRGGIPRRRYEIEGESFMCASVDIDEPATYEEAVTSPNANEWITAMKEDELYG
ncbi:UNVERIFIED_CONTAM: Copia protein [Sesamum latifolium]|uniref:Copia protein n=1 Tax=Sesamum latifolium TaxID=2727402 RepID=A0AAW2XRA1_9LAMI